MATLAFNSHDWLRKSARCAPSPVAKLSLPSTLKGRFFTPQIGDGLVAQLEERLNGIEEVVSSNLIGSTNLTAASAQSARLAAS